MAIDFAATVLALTGGLATALGLLWALVRDFETVFDGATFRRTTALLCVFAAGALALGFAAGFDRLATFGVLKAICELSPIRIDEASHKAVRDSIAKHLAEYQAEFESRRDSPDNQYKKY